MLQHRGFRVVAFGLALATAAGDASAAEFNFLLKVTVGDERLEGKPLAMDPTEVVLLQRDGSVNRFHPNRAVDFERASGRFTPYSAVELRSQLLRELGPGFTITGTGRYVVAHPIGQGDLWAERFEGVFHEFSRYFRVRGFHLREPEFPLVAIVFPTQQDFVRYSASIGGPVGPGLMGYYLFDSNRVALFDVTAAGDQNDENWHINAETVIHEVVHQAAYNTGVHTRFGGTPQWVAEGLGTMFEARGIWNSARYRTREDRINQERLDNFREYLPRRKAGAFARLVIEDTLFQTAVIDAYAEAWAATFFLAETRRRQYADYLQRVAAHPAFEDYTRQQRWQDFAAVFGTDVKKLENEFLKFIAEL